MIFSTGSPAAVVYLFWKLTPFNLTKIQLVHMIVTQ